MLNKLKAWTFEKINIKKVSLWKKTKFILNNINWIEFIKVDLDKDLKYDNIERCDFIFIIESKRKVFYVELKWNHRDKGLEQIINTIKNIYYDNNKTTTNYWYIICSNVPKENPKTQQLKLKLKREYNVILDIKSSIIEVNI